MTNVFTPSAGLCCLSVSQELKGGKTFAKVLIKYIYFSAFIYSFNPFSQLSKDVRCEPKMNPFNPDKLHRGTDYEASCLSLVSAWLC